MSRAGLRPRAVHGLGRWPILTQLFVASITSAFQVTGLAGASQVSATAVRARS